MALAFGGVPPNERRLSNLRLWRKNLRLPDCFSMLQ